MEKIKYISVNRSLLLTVFNLAMIGVNILTLSQNKPFLIPIILFPATFCKVSVKGTPDVLTHRFKIFINPN